VKPILITPLLSLALLFPAAAQDSGVPQHPEPSWSYKTNLLLELAKLSEMDHDLQLKIEYTNQANAAQLTTIELWKRKAGNPVSKP
jgi:hypothetical protein